MQQTPQTAREPRTQAHPRALTLQDGHQPPHTLGSDEEIAVGTVHKDAVGTRLHTLDISDVEPALRDTARHAVDDIKPYKLIH